MEHKTEDMVCNSKKFLRLIEACIGLKEFNKQFGTSFSSIKDFQRVYAEKPDLKSSKNS